MDFFRRIWGPYKTGGEGMSIPSLYNFVPLSSTVIYPKWADTVSHDMPFSDGVSGAIDIKAIAHSPIYVRNNGNFPENNVDRNNLEQYRKFFSMGNAYYIPGSTFKGTIRNVIEIISFSRIRIDDKKYSFRNLQS